MPVTRFEYERPKLYRKQEEAFFGDERIAVTEASPKCGKTMGCMVWLFEQLFDAPPHANLWWVAPTFGTADIAFARYKATLPQGIYQKNDSDQTLFFPDYNVTMWFKSGDNPDTLYGDDVWAAVIDEGSRISFGAWKAVRSTMIATGGKIRVIGNVNGRNNWFYRYAREAEKEMAQAAREGRKPEMRASRIYAQDAIDAGIVSAKIIDDERRDLPEEDFRELYELTPADDAGNPFGMKAIRECQISAQSSKPAVAFGLDLASKRDYCVLIGLDEDGVECYFDRWQGPWDTLIPRVVPVVRSTPCLVDATGVGDAKLTDLQHFGANYEGYILSDQKKQQLMLHLIVELQNRRRRYVDPVLRGELETMESKQRSSGGTSYAAASGAHDDAVIAFALASWHLNELMPSSGSHYIHGMTDDSDGSGYSEGGFYVPSGYATDTPGRSGLAGIVSNWRSS